MQWGYIQSIYMCEGINSSKKKISMISNIVLNTTKFISDNLTLVKDNGTVIAASILGFFVLSSKHFIIYNEETLVVISFIGFIIFSYRMLNESIENALNERSLAIYNELQNSVMLKETLLFELLEEHKKQLFLNKFLNSVREFSSQELSSIGVERQKAFQFIFAQQIQQKLKSLSSSNATTQENLQNALQKGFRGSVLEEFNFSKKTLKSKLIQQAIHSINMGEAPLKI